MSGTRSGEIVLAVAFLMALMLPITFGTRVTPPRSLLDLLNGFSRSNFSLHKLLAGPALGIGLTFAVYADPTVDRLVSLLVFVVVICLVIGALIVGARRTGNRVSQEDHEVPADGLDYASRFRRLEDQIESSSPTSSSRRGSRRQNRRPR